MKVVIIDDETRSQRLLAQMLEEYCPSVELAGIAADAFSGKELIAAVNPDLIFLDVEMPQKNGLDLLNEFDNPGFKVVLTTAYENYAQEAFNLFVHGYLLKPIDIDELIKVVERADESFIMDESHPDFGLVPITQGGDITYKVVLPVRYGISYFDIGEINYIEAEGRYSRVHCTNGQSEIVNLGINNCEEILENTWFIRVHRSTIINLRLIRKYVKGLDAHIILENGERKDIGQKHKDKLVEALNLFTK